MQVIQGTGPRRTNAIEEAYSLFRLERQGESVSPRTLEFYDLWVGRFLSWLRTEMPECGRIEEVDVDVMRRYRALLADHEKPDGRRLQPETLNASHRALRTFLLWAEDDGYGVDRRLFKLKAPKLGYKEMSLYSSEQLKQILDACGRPVESLIVEMLIGSGARASEICGVSLVGPDNMPDLNIEPLRDEGYAELRLFGKGGRTRRVRVTGRLAAGIKRYTTRYRAESRFDQVLITPTGNPYHRWGVDSIMDRIQRRVGFRVHAHAFRHTYATVFCQLGGNLEMLRAAMGHADYSVLQRYTRFSSQRNLGPAKFWQEVVYVPRPPEPWRDQTLGLPRVTVHGGFRRR